MEEVMMMKKNYWQFLICTCLFLIFFCFEVHF